ncbi:MAG: hypothetical protein K0S65_2663 [Labilithrix sp.]|nr:hypothetical protein [Labilithrix sp.]
MKRLLDDSIRPDVAELLRSAELDTPAVPKERQERVIAAIVAAPAAITVATAAASGMSGRLDLLARIAKWAAPALGIIVAAALAFSSRSAEHPASTPAAGGPEATGTAATAVPTERGTASSSATPAPSAPEPSMRVEDLPSAANSAPAARARTDSSLRPSGSGRVPESPTAPSIDAEIAAIDTARGALTAGRANEALSRVQSYRSTFASPHFADEADALEVQALAALGRTTEARQKAEQFLAAHAQSPYAQRVRSAVGLK